MAFPLGDIHQPLHTAQLFTVDYPQGDRGGNQICIRVTQAGQPMDLHRFWDGVITSSSNVTRLRNEATALRNRQEFQRGQLTELASIDFEGVGKREFRDCDEDCLPDRDTKGREYGLS